MSIKESARIAQSNNFMGIICRSSLLVSHPAVSSEPASQSVSWWEIEAVANTASSQNVVPALVETIKELGLVLVADTSDETGHSDGDAELPTTDSLGVADWAYRMPDGVNGVMKANGILRFNDMIDM